MVARVAMVARCHGGKMPWWHVMPVVWWQNAMEVEWNHDWHGLHGIQR